MTDCVLYTVRSVQPDGSFAHSDNSVAHSDGSVVHSGGKLRLCILRTDCFVYCTLPDLYNLMHILMSVQY